ncbi:MAG: hypothetical protein CMJ87_00960 [Planctomycetes bacterium]|jgi:hypothetical protein|nr:hypothetical protein [Planctomycetota bacterium]
MHLNLTIFSGLLLGLALAPAVAQPPAPAAGSATACAAGASLAADFVWDKRAVEHLYNRAGFGATRAEIARGLELGPEALVEELLSGGAEPDAFFYELLDRPNRLKMAFLGADERRDYINGLRAKDRRQLTAFVIWWVERMLAGETPLRERMTLFWHGMFTSSMGTVRHGFEMIQQNQFLRRHALGSYSDMLRGIIRDPAMLAYLDNNENHKDKPNENLAREIMELFSLGEGNYSETDVKEVARALTGYTKTKEGQFEFKSRDHDMGSKTILGQSGRFDGTDVAEILLAQRACAEWVAGRLITYLEGVEPSAERLASYATLLAESEYQVRPLLRRLFLDPEFYRLEIRGARIQGPVDYLVSSSRRLGIEPPGVLVYQGGGMLGQRLLDPPNVKGWEGGESWVTTSSLMMRGNLMGVALGVVPLEEVFVGSPVMDEPDEAAMLAARGPRGRSPRGARPDISEAMDEESASGMDGGMDSGMDMGMEGAGEAGSKGNLFERFKSLGLMREYFMVKKYQALEYEPQLNLVSRLRRRGISRDADIARELAEELLAIAPPPETLRALESFLRQERQLWGAADGALLSIGSEAEHILRRLAHLVLSLPEAQLG